MLRAASGRAHLPVIIAEIHWLKSIESRPCRVCVRRRAPTQETITPPVDDTTERRRREDEDEDVRGGRLARAATSGRGAAYEGAMEAIFAILISVGLGYWADQHFGTEPTWLIVGAVIGFAAFVLRLFRMGKLIQETGDEAAAEAPETSPQRSVASRSADSNGILGGADRRPSGDEDGDDERGETDAADR